jgi:hypothetical protein
LTALNTLVVKHDFVRWSIVEAIVAGVLNGNKWSVDFPFVVQSREDMQCIQTLAPQALKPQATVYGGCSALSASMVVSAVAAGGRSICSVLTRLSSSREAAFEEGDIDIGDDPEQRRLVT